LRRALGIRCQAAGICAFQEQGVAMLSSVLHSETAVNVNIQIMRAFVRMRRATLASQQLMPLIEDLSKRVGFTADIESSKK
jgi:hypothetical protein